MNWQPAEKELTIIYTETQFMIQTKKLKRVSSRMYFLQTQPVTSTYIYPIYFLWSVKAGIISTFIMHEMSAVGLKLTIVAPKNMRCCNV